MSNATIKVTRKDLIAHGLDVRDFIKVEDLGKYGFDEDIINGMLEYEIFPQPYLYMGSPMVMRKDIFGAVNRLLKNSIEVYRTVETIEQNREKIAKAVEDNTVKLEPEDLAAIEAGDVSYTDLLLRKIEAQTGESPVLEAEIVEPSV